LVILNRDEVGDRHILAVDCFTGKTAWKQSYSPKATPSTSQSTPIVWKNQLVIHGTGEIVAYDKEKGVRLWSLPLATRGTSSPVVGGGNLFVGAWTNFGEPDLLVEPPDFQELLKYDGDNDKHVSRAEFPNDLPIARRPEISGIRGANFPLKVFFRGIDRDGNNLITQTEWEGWVAAMSAYQRKEHGLTAITGERNGDAEVSVAWQENRSVPEVPSPLHYMGRVYMVKNGGIVSCMDRESGRLLYRKRLSATGPYYSSPIAAGEKIYFSSGEGKVTVMASGDRPQILAQNDLSDAVFATPAIVNNELYIRTVKHLYAFGG
jgi:outer membrane protein assembly factor BamB